MNYNKAKIISFIDSCIEIGLYILVFIVPLFFSKYTKQNFLLSKECFISFMVLILLSLWLVKILVNPNSKIIRSPFIYPLLIFYFINFLSIFNASNKTISLYAFYIFSNYAAIFFIMIYNIKSLKQIKIMLTMFCLTAGLVAFYGICQFFDIDPIFNSGEVRGNSGRSKVFSTFGNPTFLADYLVVVLPITIGYYIDKYRPKGIYDFLGSIFFVIAGYFILFLYAQNYYLLAFLSVVLFILGSLFYLFKTQKNNKSKVLNKLYGLIGAFSFVSIFLCIVITRTRGAWLGVFLSFVFTIFILFIVERKKMIFLIKYSFVILALLSTILASFYYLPYTHNEMEKIVSLMKNRFTNSSTIIQRFLMWQVGWQMCKHSNYIGNGMGNFKVIYSSFQYDFLAKPNVDKRYKQEAVCFRHAHNEYVQMLTEIGIPGLIAFLYLFFIFFRESYKILKNKDDFFIDMGIIAGVSAVLIQSIFNFPFHRATPTLTVFSLMAFVALKSKKRFLNKNKENLKEIEEENKNDIIDAPKFLNNKSFKLPFVIISLILILFIFLPRVSGYFNGSKRLKAGYMLITNPNAPGSREENLKLAIDHLKTSIELDPSDREGEAHYWMGVAYEELKDYDTALKWYLKALKYTQNKLVYFHIGLIYMRKNNFVEAKKYFFRTVGIVPKFVDAYFNLALIFKMEGNIDRSIEQFKKVMIYKRDYSPTYQYLGELYYKKKDYLNSSYYYGIFSDLLEKNKKFLDSLTEKNKFINLQKLISFSYKEIISEYSKKIDIKNIKIDNAKNYLLSTDSIVKDKYIIENKMYLNVKPLIEKINKEYDGFIEIINIIQEKRIPFLAKSYIRYKGIRKKYPYEINEIFNYLKYQENLIKEFNDIIEEKNIKNLKAVAYYFYIKKRYFKSCISFGKIIKQTNIKDKMYFKNIKFLLISAENSMFERLKRISKFIPYDEKFHFSLGMDFFNKEKYSDAISQWDQILSFKPADIKSLFYRGIAFYKMREYKNSLKDLEKVIFIMPESEEGKQAKKYIIEIKKLIKN